MEYIYGALLLHKLGKEVTEASLTKVVSSTGVEVDEAKVKTLIASLKGVDINKELEGASILATGSGGGAEGGEAKEDKAKEKKEEKASEAAEGLSSLFG